MKALRRTTIGTQVRHDLKRHPGVVAIIKVPTNSELAAWLRDGPNNYVQAVVNGVLALEGHPDAPAFGEPGSRERVAFVEAMDPRDLFEIGNAVDATSLVPEELAGN